MFSSLSHEFGTAINCILNVSNTALDDPIVNEEIKKSYIEHIYANSFILELIVQNIRDYNNIIANTFRLRLQVVKIIEEIDALQTLFQEQIKIRNIRLMLKYNNSVNNLSIFSDLQRLKQVLYNLISNSIRYTMNGTIIIEIKCSDDNFIEISVEDTGIGMVQLFKQNIQQDDDVSLRLKAVLSGNQFGRISSKSIGCCMGLTISNMICQNLSGDIKIPLKFASQINQGTQFAFSIYDYSKKIHASDLSGSLIQQISQNSYINCLEIQDKLIQIPKKSSTIEQKKSGKNIGQNFQLLELQGIRNQRSFTFQQNGVESEQSVEIEEEGEIQQKYQNKNKAIYIPQFSTQAGRKITNISLYAKCCSKILITDDEYFNIIALESLLKKLNTKNDFALNGQQAIEKIKQKMQNQCNVCGNKGYVIYFLDINMPVMDGFQCVKEIKRMMHNEKLQKGFCIANTAFADMDTNVNAFKAGMDFCFTKPLKIKEIFECIAKLCPK